ncbi:MAG: hypothetical protein A2Z21_02760 [Candidatus Fraserbacteria bacterium RBG_16_55_9]|uniref:DinB-like domain-containing protein n=1 Tax=Fraserbacteria sp. (strain RBG_16_55_9) TaxID=1817864 RepID=A0A1F5V2K3_FRAXR|nr:MAG: hypothetical protein A2Z21_02760 [Candidatus Fraserbacteria bacterium RBG_16_55_9]
MSFVATHSQRLLKELKEIREELIGIVAQLKPEEFDWHPRPDMKSAKDLLKEIGAMEKICVNVAAGGPKLEWERAISWSGTDQDSMLKDLESVRAETNRFLQSATEERLQKPISLPEAWHQYFGPTVEAEELVRWVARHEYYHVGQLITYRWLLGYNPYKQGAPA